MVVICRHNPAPENARKYARLIKVKRYVSRVILGTFLINTPYWRINCLALGGTNKVNHGQYKAAAYSGEGVQQTGLKRSNYLYLGLVFALYWLRITRFLRACVFFGAKRLGAAKL